MEATLCHGMNTLGMVATLVEDSQEVLFSQPLINQILVGDIYVDHLHVDLPIGPHVDGLLVGRSPINQPPIGQSHVMVVPPWIWVEHWP
jgi:hypothetical protein